LFLLIPIVLIIASASGLVFIVWRKLPRLKEVAASEVVAGDFNFRKDWRTIAYDFCPEVVDWAKNINVEEYKGMWLVEMEKLLRRLRVVSLKIDRFSDTLIKKIRRSVYSNSAPVFGEQQEEKNEKDKPAILTQENSREGFKKTEQKLILEIAKNPKNPTLYEDLGDLYAKAEDYRDAKESYEAAIELNSNDEALNKKLSAALEKLSPLIPQG